MHKNVERIFLAFLLSFVGAMVAKQFGVIWWIGLGFGFITGYIGYDIRNFLNALPVALSKSCDGAGMLIPTKERLKRVKCCAFYSFGAGSCVGFTFFGTAFLFIVPSIHIGECLQIGAYCGLFMGIYLILITSSDSKTDDRTHAHVEDMSNILQWMHPILFAIRTLPLGIFYVLRGVAWITEKGAEFGWRFAYHLYYLVHSRERVLFGLDIALGVAIGHYSSNAILGGFAGAAWWILDWHVVSLKCLKIEPAR